MAKWRIKQSPDPRFYAAQSAHCWWTTAGTYMNEEDRSNEEQEDGDDHSQQHQHRVL